MVDTEEWKKEYYGSGSMKKWIIAAIVIITIASAYLFLSDQGQPVDVGINITAKDVTYSAEGITSEEIMKAYEIILESENRLSKDVKSQYGYDWPSLVADPRDSKKCKSSALLHLFSQVAINAFEYVFLYSDFNITNEYAFLYSDFNITDQEILSLPIQKVDTVDTSKDNLLLTITYIKAIEEWYKEKGIPVAETNINRLNFLYSYFDTVDINPDETIGVYPLIYEESVTYGYVIKNIFDQYNSHYIRLMQRIEITKAENNIITIKNIGQEDISLKGDYAEINVYIDYPFTDCQWSVDVIKPGEYAYCTLEEPCTDKNVRVSAPGNTKETICS